MTRKCYDNRSSSSSSKNNKDGLDFDFQWAFGLNRLSLDFIGIWPKVNLKNEVLAKNHFSKEIRAPSMIILMLFAFVIPQLYALSFVRGQLALVIDNLLTNCTTLTSCIKLLCLWNSRQRLRPIVASLMHDWSSAEHSGYEHAVMVKQARRARIFTMSGYGIMLFCLTGVIVTPFFGLSIRIINNITDPAGHRQQFFPVQTYYPFEQAWNSPFYELIYTSQIIAGSFVAISFSVPDNFFAALVFHASAQCEILQAKLRDMVPSDPREAAYWISKNERNFQRKLGRFVQLHVRLVRFVELLENSFNSLILAQVVCLSIIMCCSGYGVINSAVHGTVTSPITQIITLGATILNLLIHMLAYCISSEILAKHSAGLSLAAYSTSWYCLPACYSHDIVQVMTRAQYPLQLSAGKFFYLSLSAYLGIIKTAAGYVSMLLTISN